MESLVNGVKGVHNNRVVVEIFEHACKFTPWYDPTLITPAIGPTPRLFRLKIIRRGAPLYPVLVRSFLRGWTRHGRLRDTTKLPRYFNPVEVEEEDGLLRSTCLPYAGKEGKRERERRFTPRFSDVRICDSRLVSREGTRSSRGVRGLTSFQVFYQSIFLPPAVSPSHEDPYPLRGVLVIIDLYA